MVTHRGGCHCGRVRFEVAAPAKLRVDACNCSICSKVGYLHLIVPRSRFELVRGADCLTAYTFHTGVARHTFCAVCGVKSFYVPRSHPEGISVNARCIDPGTIQQIEVRPFDGANWEAHASELEPLSDPAAAGAGAPRSMQFWFEFGSTYSYPAALRIAGLAEARGVSIEWKPFLLGPIFGELGWNDSPFNLQPAKGRYMWRDLERICDKHEIPFRRPSQFPRNGLLAARVAGSAAAAWLPEFVRSVFRANFAEDLDISDPAVIAARLDSLGQPGGDLVERAQSPESKEALRRQTQRAAEIGIFGAPAFVVETELFWGHDRLEDALAWRGAAAGLH